MLGDRVSATTKMLGGACRRYGLLRTLRLWSSELLFDLRNRTSTALDLRGASLHVRNRSGGHEGSNPLLFAELIRHAPVDRASSAFLDYGAGKGRALLLAAEHGFSKAIGVEVNPELCAIARSNIAIYRSRHAPCALQVHCADASVFEVPDDVSVAYFFNPFGPEVMRAALARIAESLGRRPREFFIVYLHPSLEALLLEAGFTRVWRHGADGAILVGREVTVLGRELAARAAERLGLELAPARVAGHHRRTAGTRPDRDEEPSGLVTHVHQPGRNHRPVLQLGLDGRGGRCGHSVNEAVQAGPAPVRCADGAEIPRLEPGLGSHPREEMLA